MYLLCYESTHYNTTMMISFMTIFYSLVPRMVEKVDYELLIVNNNIEVTINITKVKATIHRATLLLATVVTRLWQPCSRVVTAWLQPGYNCCSNKVALCMVALRPPYTMRLCSMQQLHATFVLQFHSTTHRIL